MPSLEEKIADWRKRMAAGGINTPAVLDELEGHLREEILAQLDAGASEAEAFQSAVVRIGNPGAIRAEFNKVKSATCLPVIIGSSIWTIMAVLLVVLLLRDLLAGTRSLLLSAHIFCLTAGYLAAFLSGGLSVCYVCWRWAGGLSATRERSLDRAVFWFSHFCMGLIITGLLLGMLWAKKNRGSYWDGGPREIATGCAAIWFAALWLVQRFGQVNERMLLCIGGNVVVALAWFGAGIVANPGIHLYEIGNYWPLYVFLGIHLFFFVMAFTRRFETVKS